MAIKQIKREVKLPPSHLYLEDIEEIVDVFRCAEERRTEHRPKEYVVPPKLRFTVGKNRECDTIDDLKILGGTWRNFKMEVGSSAMGLDIYDAFVIIATREGELYDRILRLFMTRQVVMRSITHQIPWLPFLLCVLPGLLVFRPPLLWERVALIGFVAIVILVVVWCLSAHTIVELRYSHDPSPRVQKAKESGSRIAWIIVGVLLTSIVQWLWNYATKH
jgi:hypothetical protein